MPLEDLPLFDFTPIQYENFIVRALNLSDYHKNYLPVLELLTGVGQISEDEFKSTFLKMQQGKMHYIFVATNLSDSKIIGTGTLGVEQKFIRNCALKGRVEDLISVNTEFVSRSDIDQKIMESIVNQAHQLGCYKMSLESIDNHLRFYEKFGFKVDAEIEMANRHIQFEDNTESRYQKDMQNTAIDRAAGLPLEHSFF